MAECLRDSFKEGFGFAHCFRESMCVVFPPPPERQVEQAEQLPLLS